MMLFWLHWTRFIAVLEVLWVVMVTTASLETAPSLGKSPTTRSDSGNQEYPETISNNQHSQLQKHHVSERVIDLDFDHQQPESNEPNNVTEPSQMDEEQNLTIPFDSNTPQEKMGLSTSIDRTRNKQNVNRAFDEDNRSSSDEKSNKAGPILNNNSSTKVVKESNMHNIDPELQESNGRESKLIQRDIEKVEDVDGAVSDGGENQSEAVEKSSRTDDLTRRTSKVIDADDNSNLGSNLNSKTLQSTDKCSSLDDENPSTELNNDNSKKNSESEQSTCSDHSTRNVSNNRTVGPAQFSSEPFEDKAPSSQESDDSQDSSHVELSYKADENEGTHPDILINHQDSNDRLSTPRKIKNKSSLETKTLPKDASSQSFNADGVKKKTVGIKNKSKNVSESSQNLDSNSGNVDDIINHNNNNNESLLLMSDQPEKPPTLKDKKNVAADTSPSFAAVDDSSELIQHDNESAIAIVNASVVETSDGTSPPSTNGHTMKAINSSGESSQLGGLDIAIIAGIAMTILVISSLVGAASFVLYRHRYWNKPQTLSDKCSNADSSGYIDDSTLRENSEEMYSLDNDSFLNSLEAMTIQNYWTDNVKHTKL